MISYHLVAFDHDSETFSFKNELLELIMDKGDSFTDIDSSEYKDLLYLGVPEIDGWHWAKDNVDTDSARWFSYELLRRALNQSNSKTNPTSEEL
jgi:hypothetical protein